jgi:pimeloyl-ACP methyl ester carboxylesterase
MTRSRTVAYLARAMVVPLAALTIAGLSGGARSAPAAAPRTSSDASLVHQLTSCSPARHAKPTVVLVHGAWADASSWSGEVTTLQRAGYDVRAIANPLQDLTTDSQYVADYLKTIRGPVVLVGHSYGGAVITNAATGDPDVQALVYIAAFALAEGESVAQASALAGGSNDLLSHIVLRPFGPGANDQDAYIDPVFFRQTFAQDVSRRTTDVMAVSQRPAALATLGEPSGPPAWAEIPSWYLVAHNDNTIPPVAERAMAQRAGSHTVEIKSSHVAMISHPAVVTRLVERAAHNS